MRTALVSLARCICGCSEGAFHQPRCPRMIADAVRNRLQYCVECGYSGLSCWSASECLGNELIA